MAVIDVPLAFTVIFEAVTLVEGPVSLIAAPVVNPLPAKATIPAAPTAKWSGLSEVSVNGAWGTTLLDAAEVSPAPTVLVAVTLKV